MNNKNKFYTSISNYYSEIFPYKPLQLQFVKKRLGRFENKSILDVGCATGELAFHLAQERANVTGIDLNEDLLKKATEEKQHPDLRFKKGNMLNIANDFQPNGFDAVLCFGNTLVHLPDLQSIEKMFKGVFETLKPGGKFLLQILNYDYILDEKVSELPLIETENIKFIRKYIFSDESRHVSFQTELHLKKIGQVITNETKLLALKSSELLHLLTGAGFTNIQFFANFKEETFGGKHLPLVACAEKK